MIKGSNRGTYLPTKDSSRIGKETKDRTSTSEHIHCFKVPLFSRDEGHAGPCLCIAFTSTLVIFFVRSPDNAMYRVGSRHIAPLFSKSPSHRERADTYEYPANGDANTPTPMSNRKNLSDMLTSNGSSNPYDTPREVLDSNTYSIPTSLPAMVGNDYINHTVATQVSVEPLIPPGGHTQKGPEAVGECVPMDQKQESGDYIYMSGTNLDNEVVEHEEDKATYFAPEDVSLHIDKKGA